MTDGNAIAETFRIADQSDAERIAALVNAAYRGESGAVGWTHEAHLFDGPRTDAAEIGRLIGSDDSLILLCMDGPALAGSVHLKKIEGGAYLGLLAVSPALQGSGAGRRLIERAERFVRESWGCARMSMTVLTLRRELIEYYERRGYQHTGKVEPLTMEGQAGRPKSAELQLAWLEKALD
jgi:GNAT superfamily N-acetyltransferase